MGERLLKPKLLSLISLALVFITLNACSGIHKADNHPLKVDDGSTGEVGVCRSKTGDCWSMSILFISNEGESAITIDSVSLTDAEGMSVIETSLMEIGEEKALLGVMEWPPFSTPDSFSVKEEFPNFETRISAEGAVIEPGNGYNLIIVVEALADEAYASGLEIIYEDENGTKYSQKSYYAYRLNGELLK